MRLHKPDQDKAKEEELQRKREQDRAKDKEEYLQELKKDERFRKYVIQDILEPRLEELTDIRKQPNSGSYTDLGKSIVIAKAARRQLEKIIGDLT